MLVDTMKLSFLVGMALSGAIARTPALPVDVVPIFNEDGTMLLDSTEVSHVLDLGELHVTLSRMLQAGISCVSVVYLPSTTFQSCSVNTEIQK
jgi:hypothetical protein